MNFKSHIQNFLYDKNYAISVFDNNIYFFNYKSINYYSLDQLIIDFKNFKVIIKGKNFIINKFENNQLLIKGTCYSLEFQYE